MFLLFGFQCSFVPLCAGCAFSASRFASHRLLPTPIPLSVSLGLGPARPCGFYFRWVSRPWPLLPPAGLCQTLPCAPKKRIGGSGPLAHNRSPFPWPRQAWLVAFALLGLLCFAVPCLRFAACAASTIAGSGECIWHFVWLFLARLRVTGSFCHSRARSGSSGAAFLICLCFAGAACCELQTALTPERVEALATEVIQICLLLATLSLCGLIFRVIGFSLSPLGRGFLRVCSLAGNDSLTGGRWPGTLLGVHADDVLPPGAAAERTTIVAKAFGNAVLTTCHASSRAGPFWIMYGPAP